MLDRILRRPEVQTTTGLSRSSIYLRMKNGSFPKQVNLGGSSLVGWRESEIKAWLDTCVVNTNKAA